MQETTPAEKYIINLASENEYPEQFNAEKEKQNIQTSTMSAFTVDFELRKLVSNCNSSVTRMTPCLEEAYDNLFGSEYNHKVNKFCWIQRKIFWAKNFLLEADSQNLRICYTACSGRIWIKSKKSEKLHFLKYYYLNF